MNWRDGIYEGEVFGQFPNGEGRFENEKGVYIGNWTNGVLNGDVFFTNKKGEAYKLFYENDKIKSYRFI